MKANAIYAVLVSLAMLIFVSCSVDEEIVSIATSDITISVDENQENGASLTFVDGSSMIGAVTYSIISQNPTGATEINGNSGELTVDDGSLFNYELNSSMFLTVEMTNGINIEMVNVLIKINDIDDIQDLLMTSQTAYMAASDNTWIQITYGEYELIKRKLLQVSKVATSDSEWMYSAYISSELKDYTVVNNNGHAIPSGSYLVAFKYYAQTYNKGNMILVSTDGIGGPYREIGRGLPGHGAGYNYFILKGSNERLESTAYLGYFFTNNTGWKEIPTANYSFIESGPATYLSDNTITAVNLYQGLTTTIRQW